MSFIVITGNPVDGFSYFGPYENAQDATDDAGEAVLALDWWVAPLLSVDELNDPNGDAAELPDPTPPVVTVTSISTIRDAVAESIEFDASTEESVGGTGVFASGDATAVLDEGTLRVVGSDGTRYRLSITPEGS